MNSETMIRVSKDIPCPVCNKSDWCLVAEDGSAAICARTEPGSVKRCGEAGWLHKLLDDNFQPKRRISHSIAMPKAPSKDFTALAKKYQDRLDESKLRELAKDIGVSADSLKRLGIGWNSSGFTFPMSDASGQIIGIRIRYLSGLKAAEKDSRQGLFIPTELPAEGLLLICEGPTDTAAALDLGFTAVGRPSCNSGTQMLAKVARGRDVVIVADNDPPGRKGAEALASELVLYCLTVRLVYPPDGIKDLRQWKVIGLTREQLQSVIKQSKPLRIVITTRSGRAAEDE